MMTDEEKKAQSDKMKKYWEERKAKEALEKESTGNDTAKAVENKVVETPVKQAEVVPQANLTEEERAIFQRVMSDSEGWKNISVDQYATNDFSLAEDPFKIPEPAKKLERDKQFKFKWITRSRERLDEVKNKSFPFAWWPVNNVQPVVGLFGKFVDGSTGGIHLLDQILVFKPWAMWMKEQEVKHRIADTKGDFLDKNNQEPIDNVRIAASSTKLGGPRKREHITGSDIQFEGEAERDAEAGIKYDNADFSDLVVNE
jgi:hypothetical protein